MGNNCISYQIDKENRIVSVGDEWQTFADMNMAGHLTKDAILNRSIFEFITDIKCQHIYETLINRSRTEQKVLEFPFRCDAPEKRRFMKMEIFPLENGSTGFMSCIVREEDREPVMLLDTSTEKSDEFLIICSWCKKIKTDETYWLEAEEAVDRLNLFGATALPQLTHGMCPACFNKMREELRSK